MQCSFSEELLGVCCDMDIPDHGREVAMAYQGCKMCRCAVFVSSMNFEIYIYTVPGQDFQLLSS